MVKIKIENIVSHWIKRLLIMVLFSVFAISTVYSNDKEITLRYNNVPLKTVLTSIEKQTKMVFIYNNDAIDDMKFYSINCQKSSFISVLQKLFQSEDIEFKIVDYYVFLSKPESEVQKINEDIVSVEGYILNDYRQPLVGASVMSTARILKAQTDNNGYFNFQTTKSDSALVFYMMGYYEKKVPIQKKNYEVVLNSKNILLNEVLVVGYGSVSTKELTGSVVSMKPDLLNKSNEGDVTSSIQGRISGVYANNDRLLVRGISSINSSSDPLIVVDGVPQYMLLKDLNPDDIESLEVLKDAASAAIYGARASNGVILVTTRSGNLNSKPKISVDYRSGLNFIVNQPRYLKGAALLELFDEAYYNKYPERKLLPDSNPIKFFPFSSDYTGYSGYDRKWLTGYLSENINGQDWVKNLSQPMLYNDFRLSFNGGQAESKYLVSFSYKANEDFIKERKSERLTLLIKNEYKLRPGFVIGLTSNSVVNFANNTTGPSVIQAFTRSSLLPVYSPDNSDILFDTRNINNKKGSNPLYQMQETWDDNVEINNVISLYLEIKASKTIDFRTDWSVNGGTRRYRYYQSKEFYQEDEAIDPSKSGMIMYARTLNYGINGNNVLTFKPFFSKNHRTKFILGNNIQSFNSDFNVARFEGFPTDYFQLTNANTGRVLTTQSAGMDGYRFVSFFSRMQYSFKDKLFAELNARTDGTSRFNPTNSWGFFPGIGLSWLMSDEPFVKRFTQIDYLKLKSSFGLVGNAEMGNFPAQSRVLNWAEYAGSAGFLLDRIGNNDVTWEKQSQLNIGISASTLKNRVMVDLDLYFKRCNELLINYNIGSFHGYFNTDVTINSGVMNNNGVDFNITTHNFTGALKWKTDLNISSFNTKILQLSTQQSYLERGVNRVVVGQPLALYYLPLWAGIDPETGHELIYEVTGTENQKVKTGKVLDAEVMDYTVYNQNRVLIIDKTPYPKFYGGLTNTFNHKNWELSFLIIFQYGNWLYHSGLRQGSYVNTFDIQNKYAVISDHWSLENPNSKVPLLYNSQMSNRENSRYLVDGSYLRLRNLTINYSLPPKILLNLHLKSIRLLLQAQNLLTFSKFQDGDPEVATGASGSEANISPGNVGSNYGVLSLNFGINIGF